MKQLIITIILMVPCFLIFSEAETILPNIIAFIYTIGLYKYSMTEKGKKLFLNAYKYVYRMF